MDRARGGKLPSNPISIGAGKAGAAAAASRPAQKPVSHSMPNVRYNPPQPPVARPRQPTADPPPMELPPSPPVNNDFLLKRELDKRERANLQPSSRSLIWGGLSSSLPPNMMLPGGPSSMLASSFSGKTPLDSLREDPTAELEETPIERKTSTSLSEPSNTIYSMMRSSSISGPSSPPVAPSSAGLPMSGIGALAHAHALANANRPATRLPPPSLRSGAPGAVHQPQPPDPTDAADETQFSLSLDHQDESFMMDEETADNEFMQPYDEA